MDVHHDNITTLFANGTGTPVLTVLVGLNDRNQYTGGELILFDDLEILLNPGDVLIFPSAFMYPHRVNMVTSGERWSLVNWLI
jgi:predicted 2-oxoglutarate/Fe(II)-dependent dioxygenase YbiX